MMPVYMMNSVQPGQMRAQGQYPQGFGNYPNHVTMDASSPVSCEHLLAPSPCHGSCVHGNFPAFNPYCPPCHPAQVPYHPCCMNYSGFHPHASHPHYIPQPFPTGYQSWYDSESNVPGMRRCAKCSPQMCCPKNEKRIVIEEHEPEIENRDNGNAVKPVRSTNCPYSIIQIPHDNSRSQELRSSPGSGSHNQLPPEVKLPENTMVHKCDPKSWNGCFTLDENTVKSLLQNLDRIQMQNGNTVETPFDITKLKSLLQGQEGKEVQVQKNKEPGQLPYPIFWIPSHEKQEDVEASENKERCSEGRNSKSQHKGEEGNIKSKVHSDAEEKSSMRIIPVANNLQGPRNIPVKLVENHLPKPAEPTKGVVTTAPVEKTKKEQPMSPPKASRLPPVCLRVDSLPKRKNGGSKSASPPRRKEQPLSSEETKVVSSLSSNKTETKTVTTKSEEANKEKKMFEERLNATGTEKETVNSNYNLQEGANCATVRPCETVKNIEKPAKKIFTKEEAARVIQSGFRGYDLRRWEPRKKLKEIATVREQISDVKKRIQALEVSAEHNEEKEIVILEEMVMNLLLKLDSVQGLHPSIRDYRKSLAKELSDIQEKLDYMKNSSASVEKEAQNEQVEISSQTSDSPVKLERTQPADDKKTVSTNMNAENVLPSSDEHSSSLMDITDEQLAAKAEEGSGLFETSATDPEAVVTSTTNAEKMEEVKNDLPINPLSADENEVTVTYGEEDYAVGESLEEQTQVLETKTGIELPENASGVSEAEAETVERKGDDDTILPSEKDVELSEQLTVGVIDNETQILSQDSSTCTRQVETAIQEESDVDQSSDNFKGKCQETCEPQEEKEESPGTEVTMKEEAREDAIPEETRKLMEENQRFKETMETLLKAGREQLEVISELTGRVKSLEKKLSQKKRSNIGRRKPCRVKHVTKPSSTNAVL